MKAIYLSIFALLFAACGNRSGKAEPENPQNDFIGVTTDGNEVEEEVEVDEKVEDDEEKVEEVKVDEDEADYEGGKVCVSADGRVTIESGMYSGGGTSPDFWSKWTIVNDAGKKREVRFGNSSYQNCVYPIRKTDGSIYYIVKCFGKASSVDGYEWLQAYRIVGDTIQEVNVADGGKHIDNNGFSVNYSIPHWYFATNGAGYDWMFEYDDKTRNLYVPIEVDGRLLSDRYMVWHFNGKRFECLGERSHRDMHQSLSTYKRLICYFTTRDYIVRVDSLDSRELRYASWKKPKTMANKPDIVITGGKKREYAVAPDELPRCDDYYFIHGEYEYIVNYCEVDTIAGRHHDFLLVRKNDKILLKQEKE